MLVQVYRYVVLNENNAVQCKCHDVKYQYCTGIIITLTIRPVFVSFQWKWNMQTRGGTFVFVGRLA